jgi:hypothetical protein
MLYDDLDQQRRDEWHLNGRAARTFDDARFSSRLGSAWQECLSNS